MLDTVAHLSDDQLSAHLDGQLPEAEAVVANAHLGSCAICRAALTELQFTVGLLRTLPELVPPRSFRVEAPPASLWSRIMQWDLGVRGLAAAAAALFVVMVSGDLRAPGETPAALPPPTALTGAAAPRSAPARFSLTPQPAPTSAAGITAAAPAPPAQSASAPAAESARAQPAAPTVALAQVQPTASDAARERAGETETTQDAAASAGDPLGSIRLATVLAGVAALILSAVAIVRARRRA